MTVIDDVDDDFADVEPEPEPEVKSSRAKAPATRRKAAARMPRRALSIRDALAKQMFTVGAMMGMGLPVTGYYVCQESDGFSDAIIRLAVKDGRYLDALEKITDIAPGVMIGRTVLGVGCAIGVDRWLRTDGERGIDPGKRAAMLLGVSAAWWEVTHGERDSPGPAAAASPPHAAFVPVT